MTENIELIQQIKTKLLSKINEALDGAVSIESASVFLNGIAKLEENEINRDKQPLQYDKLVEDVNAIVEKLPTAEVKTSEVI